MLVAPGRRSLDGERLALFDVACGSCRDDADVQGGVGVGDQGQGFSGEQWRMSGEVDERGDALGVSGGR